MLDNVGQNFADDVERGTARLLDHRDVKVALLVGLHLGVANRLETRRLEESGDGVVGRADARALLFLAHVGLARRHAMHRKRQPPRRHERLGAVVSQASRDQPVGHGFAQILRRPRLHARRDFLGEKFEQEIGHDLWRALFPLPLVGRGRGGGREDETLNHLKHTVDVLHHVVIPETQYAITFSFKEPRSLCVELSSFRVLTAIELNHEL